MSFIPLLLCLLVAFIVLAIYGIVAFVSYNASEQRALMYALSVAAKKQVPLPEVAAAISQESMGPSSWKARRLSLLLEQGAALPDALRTSHRNLSNEVRMAAACGWKMDCLGTALATGLATQDTFAAVTRQTVLKIVYIFIMLLIIMAVVAWTCVFILPAFEAMYRDFGLELPALTAFVILVGNGITSCWYLWVPFLLLSLLGAALLLLFACGLLPSRLFFGGLLTFTRDRAMVLQALALGLESGWSISRTLEVALATPTTRMIRQRVTRVVSDLNDGALWLTSLARHGLIYERECQVLQAAQRSGNLKWALQEVSQAALRRRLQRVQVFYNTVLPLVILLLGSLVGVIIVALFLPLIQLIQGLT